MSEFLLELFSEEIPARMQAKAADDLKRLVSGKIKDAGLSFDRADAYVTPRRLCLHITELDTEQPDIREERRGPRADAPERAIEGFLKGAGVTRDKTEIREEKKGSFLYAIIERKGRKTPDVLAEFLPEIIRNFPWPKSQRWGDKSLRWVRPLHSILCLFDGNVVGFDLDDLRSGRQTRGHRFLAPEPFEISSFADYQAKLTAAYVIPDPAERKDLIHTQAIKLAQNAGLTLLEDEGLLNEVTGLAEYPVVLMGEFDREFLDVPPEALTSAMKKHQKYFSLTDGDGKLANKFIFVANMKAADGGAKIIDGNERVLRARLADTKFFWDQDLKVNLEERLPALNNIIFHAKLGTVGERVKRLVELSGYIAEQIGADVAQARRTALLCKADLVSGMVGEFADLQGLMGKYYAEIQGEPTEVANAIAEHYSPKGPGDKCPSSPVSIAVALAEKLDSLVGFFRFDESPTGSKDPFALRRATLGVIRLIIENKLRLNLDALFTHIDRNILGDVHYKNEQGQNMTSQAGLVSNRSVYTEKEWKKDQDGTLHLIDFKDFVFGRLVVFLKGQGYSQEYLLSIYSNDGEDDLVRLLARVDALQNFLSTDEGANLLAGYKRAANILKAEEKKDGPVSGVATAGTLPEEKELFVRLAEVSVAADKAIADEKFEDAMSGLATLRPAIDAFFDKVTVNCDDEGERLNRLRLLAQIRTTMNRVADFSKIEG